MAIIFTKNILITDYLNINSKTLVNLLNDKFLSIKSYFVNKNI